MKTLAELGLSDTFRRPVRPWRIGVIGLGGIAGAHLPAYRAAGWPVAAAADLAPERREWARREHSLQNVTDDWRAVVDDPAVEVVSVLTQPAFRLPVADACAAMGKPLLVEKPMAASVDEGRRMAELAVVSGLATTVSQNYRWLPAPFAARQVVERGWIGRPHLVSVEIHGTQDRDLRGHAFYAAAPDFITVQWNTHLSDLVRHLSGRDGVRVFAHTRRSAGQNFAGDNLLLSWTDLGEGVTGLVVHSELLNSGLAVARFRVDGDRGSVSGGIWAPEMVLDSAEAGRVEVDLCGLANSFAGPMGDLMASAEAGEEPLLSFRRNLPTLEAVHAEHAAASAGGRWADLGAHGS